MSFNTERTYEIDEFICGVVEGFYGRPWSSDQRKDLFKKMNNWGMNCYLYAPKDDNKHRMYWRELYTVEEAENLTSLINAAREENVTFYYALSPGLDISYSQQKDIALLKRKFNQISQFGCNAFALLFDDIEADMTEADKEVFQTLANAQVSVTNDLFHHLGQPKFLLCPTQYCGSRAVPNVINSEYLNTIGNKLIKDIGVMWTGCKVISRQITPQNLEEISDVLKRQPVLWDNLHANDYDNKRIFLGPYSGRSANLKSKIRGVVTNPNCEYGANFVAIHTLSQWCKCSDTTVPSDTLLGNYLNELTANKKLETGSSNLEPMYNCSTSNNIYHPRRALTNAILDWLPEFNIEKQTSGPIIKPQPVFNVVGLANGFLRHPDIKVESNIEAPIALVPAMSTHIAPPAAMEDDSDDNPVISDDAMKVFMYLF